MTHGNNPPRAPLHILHRGVRMTTQAVARTPECPRSGCGHCHNLDHHRAGRMCHHQDEPQDPIRWIGSGMSDDWICIKLPRISVNICRPSIVKDQQTSEKSMRFSPMAPGSPEDTGREQERAVNGEYREAYNHPQHTTFPIKHIPIAPGRAGSSCTTLTASLLTRLFE